MARYDQVHTYRHRTVTVHRDAGGHFRPARRGYQPRHGN